MTHAHPYAFIGPSPVWVWVGVLIVLAPCLALVALFALEPFMPKPVRKVQVGDTSIELWERERRMPGTAQGIVVPVATDLKMATGIAKWVKDATANTVQYEALKVAPLPPGDAFVGSGGRYRFGHTALAVVMDEQKRTSPEWIAQGVATALRMLRGSDAADVILPDMTEDLLRQPQWISEQQRRETCRPIARAMMDGILSGGKDTDRVKIWAWRGNRDIWIEEFARLEQAEASGDLSAAHA